jgi:hypothetical protein
MLFAEFSIFRHVPAGLPHKPYGNAINRFATARFDKSAFVGIHCEKILYLRFALACDAGPKAGAP